MQMTDEEYEAFQRLFKHVCYYETIENKDDIDLYRIKVRNNDNERIKLLKFLLEQGILLEFIRAHNGYRDIKNNEWLHHANQRIRELNTNVVDERITFDWMVANTDPSNRITNWGYVFYYYQHKYDYENPTSKLVWEVD